MEFNDLLKEVHHRIEAKERTRITQVAMAKRLGISARTYTEYLRGTNSPLSMKAMIVFLSQLNDEEILKVVREWTLKPDTNQIIQKNV
jgi:putative transcriptional regulator